MTIAKKTGFTFNHADQQDKVYLTYDATTLKQKYDSRSEEMRTFVNNLIDALAAITDGNSGADNVGATAITGLTGTTVQAILESMKLQLDNATAGALPDFSVTLTKNKNYKKVVDSGTYDSATQVYTTVRYRRPSDDTLALECVLSNKDGNGNYGTDTWKYYDSTGTTVQYTVTWTYTYDANGNIITSIPA